MADEIQELRLGEHFFATQTKDGTLELYAGLDEIVEESEADETVYELFVYRQIDIRQSA